MCELAFIALMGLSLCAAASEPNPTTLQEELRRSGESSRIKHISQKTTTYVRRDGQLTINIELGNEPSDSGHLIEIVLRVCQPGKKVKIYNVDVEM